jgi:rhodanese-related sulfurtransferase
MKKLILFFGLMFAGLSTLQAANSSQGYDYESHYKMIHTAELKKLLASNDNFLIFDARPKKFQDDAVLPKAKYLPSDSADDIILKMAPDKSQKIVVYCASIECPASKYLAERMVYLGYTNVFKYPEGIDGWEKAGNEFVKPTN